MTITTLISQAPGVLLWLGVAALTAYVLVGLFRHNRLLFWCLWAASAVLIVVGAVLWKIGHINSELLFPVILGVALASLVLLFLHNRLLFSCLVAAAAFCLLSVAVSRLAGRAEITVWVSLIAATLLAALVLLFRHNRLLFWCLIAVAVLCPTSMGAATLISRLFQEHREAEEKRIVVALRRVETPKPPPKKSKPAPKLPTPRPKPMLRPIALPKGRIDSKTKTKVMPKGKTLKTKKAGKPGKKAGPKRIAKGPPPPRVSRNVITGSNPNAATVPDDDKGSLFGDDPEGISTGDIHGLKGSKTAGSGGGEGGTGGEGGENAGTPEGTGTGDIPQGFNEGKIGGRLYFVRLKHSGAWSAWDSGTRKLLAFLRASGGRVESDSRAFDANEMRQKYLRKGARPAFLYLYCDDSFSLSSSEVSILRDYIAKGGFLFLDSRPDPDIRARVSRQMNKVVPDGRLAPISRTHPINSFVYKLSSPGVGEDFSGQKNYGVSRGGRLVAFYTMGNFSHFYDENPPSADYAKAQYQMGVNVMVYGINKGDDSGISKRRGASAKITRQVLEDLGFLDKPKPKPRKPRKPGERDDVKVRKTPKPGATPGGPDDEPDEIKVLED